MAHVKLYKWCVVVSALITIGVRAWCAEPRGEPTADDIREQAIRIDEEHISAPQAKLLSRLKPFRVIALGELHGSNECPEFMRNLVDWFIADGSSLTVGLEIPQSYQSEIDQFMKSGDEAILQSVPHFRSVDGRGSRAMARLLKDLRIHKNIRILLFDTKEVQTAQDRDSQMAVAIAHSIKAHGSERVLILCGSVHASLEKGMPFDSSYKPMLYELCHQPGSPVNAGEVYNIFVQFQGGQSWCRIGPKPNPPYSFSKHHDQYTDAVDWNMYFLPLSKMSKEGYKSVLFIRRLSASPPFVQ